MAFGSPAEDAEIEVLREVFGPTVQSVTFYDAEDACDGFELAVAYDGDDNEIGQVGPEDPRWHADHGGLTLDDIPGERGETVKFYLTVPPPETPEPVRAAAYVLVVRYPDSGNEIGTTDGDVEVVNIDLGGDFCNTPDNEQQAVEFTTTTLADLNDVPTDTAVYRGALETIRGAVGRYPAAGALVDAYNTRRVGSASAAPPPCSPR